MVGSRSTPQVRAIYGSRTHHLSPTSEVTETMETETLSATKSLTLTMERTITGKLQQRNGDSAARNFVNGIFGASASLGMTTFFYAFFILLLLVACHALYYMFCSLYSPKVYVDTFERVSPFVALLQLHSYIGGVIPCHYRCAMIHSLQLCIHVYLMFLVNAILSLTMDISSSTSTVIVIVFVSAFVPNLLRPLFQHLFFYYRADEDIVRELEWERQYQEREAKYRDHTKDGAYPRDDDSPMAARNERVGVSNAALEALDHIEFDDEDDDHHRTDAYPHDQLRYESQEQDRYTDEYLDSQDLGMNDDDPHGENWEDEHVVDLDADQLGDEDYAVYDDGERTMTPRSDVAEDFAFVGLNRPDDASPAGPARRGLRGGGYDKPIGLQDSQDDMFVYDDDYGEYGAIEDDMMTAEERLAASRSVRDDEAPQGNYGEDDNDNDDDDDDNASRNDAAVVHEDDVEAFQDSDAEDAPARPKSRMLGDTRGRQDDDDDDDDDTVHEDAGNAAEGTSPAMTPHGRAAAANAVAAKEGFRRRWEAANGPKPAQQEDSHQQQGDETKDEIILPPAASETRSPSNGRPSRPTSAATSSYHSSESPARTPTASDDEGTWLPIKTRMFWCGLMLVGILIVILVVDYVLLLELRTRDNNVLMRIMLGSVILDMLVFQQLYLVGVYLHRKCTDEDGIAWFELHPFEGQLRMF